jgi:hypothetical protein
MPQDCAEQSTALGSLPWLLPRARAVLTNPTGAVQRSELPALDLKDGKLNNAVLISAAAAIDVLWRGSKSASKNKAIDYVVLDAQGSPFRSDPTDAKKAGKGIFVQAKAATAEATKCVRSAKDAELAALLSRPWGSAAYPPFKTTAAMEQGAEQLPAWRISGHGRQAGARATWNADPATAISRHCFALSRSAGTYASGVSRDSAQFHLHAGPRPCL